ncbi:MAG: hypothetical protein ACE1ZK_02385, partial [Nitrospirales bacterium]
MGCRDFQRLARELAGMGEDGTVSPRGETQAQGEGNRESVTDTAVVVTPERVPDVSPLLMAGKTAVPTSELLRKADLLAADAAKLLATSETLVGRPSERGMEHV